MKNATQNLRIRPFSRNGFIKLRNSEFLTYFDFRALMRSERMRELSHQPWVKLIGVDGGSWIRRNMGVDRKNSGAG